MHTKLLHIAKTLARFERISKVRLYCRANCDIPIKYSCRPPNPGSPPSQLGPAPSVTEPCQPSSPSPPPSLPPDSSYLQSPSPGLPPGCLPSPMSSPPVIPLCPNCNCSLFTSCGSCPYCGFGYCACPPCGPCDCPPCSYCGPCKPPCGPCGPCQPCPPQCYPPGCPPCGPCKGGTPPCEGSDCRNRRTICPPPCCFPGPIPPNPCCPQFPKGNYRRYRALFLVMLPIIVLLTLNALGQDHCPKGPCREFEYMRRRTKRFPWGDGDKSLFHNDHFNHLPAECEPPPMICVLAEPPNCD